MTRLVPTKKKKPVVQSEGYLGGSPLGLIVYGPPGVGKTSFAAHFPKPMFIHDPTEDGISDLVEYKRVPPPLHIIKAKDYNHTLSLCGDLISGVFEGVETVVFDSLTGFEKLIFAYHCEKYFDDDWTSKGFYAYQQGPKNAAKTTLPELLEYFESIRAAGINVIILGHSSLKPYANPEGPDYDRYSCACDKETWAQVHRWAKAVIFANFFTEVQTDKGNTKKGKAKSKHRLMYTEWEPSFDAKNRYGISDTIDMGETARQAYTNFENEMKKARLQEYDEE